MSKHSESYKSRKKELENSELVLREQIEQEAEMTEKSLISGLKIAAGVLIITAVGFTAFKLSSKSSNKSKKTKGKKQETAQIESPVKDQLKSIGMMILKKVAESMATNLIKNYSKNLGDLGKAKDS
jgi:hypothetical protein